ncbi:response regulator transcription factor [Synechococcus sp. CCY 9618]|uniref:response regulator transcription factor n=1 Tax=Synechococcus sp. CCY 9618 TaxID=2815602 RepID=UPI001C242BD4|nr:response regulator transcription factor [Synechococcus sp. CCY 9618]
MPAETTQARLLIVEDDQRMRTFLAGELNCEGYGVSEAEDGQGALMHLRDGSTDLVILDWTLPDFSGVEICRRLRSSGDITPVLMLTCHDDVRDRVEALDSGADDYILKPFSIEELLARIRAHLRRTAYWQGAVNADEISYGDLSVNTATREVLRAKAAISLSVREYDLLLCLLRRAGRVVEREDILREVWGENHFGDENLLGVYIRYLRRKLEPDGLPTLIQTVRGVGFMLREGEPRP